MKNILRKCNIHGSTYFLFFLSFLCGYFKNIVILFGIVFFHEIGHIICSLCFHYSVIEVIFYPFGGVTRIDKPLNSNVFHDFIISIAGILMQCLLFGLFYLLKSYMNIETYEMCMFYNISLIFFNVLPMIPLDGSQMLHCLLEMKYPYRKAWKIYFILSILCFFLFLLWNIFIGKQFFICGVLFFQFLMLKKKESFFWNRFCLERYLYNYPYHKIESHPFKDIYLLKRDTFHYFYDKKGYKDEKEVLKDYYSKG